MSNPLKLTKNFYKKEAIKTDTGLPNKPSLAQWALIFLLAVYIAQPLRDRFGKLRVNSWFRSRAVNISIKGSRYSQHCRGEAIDLKPLISGVTVEQMFKWVVHESGMRYGQVIWEKSGKSEWLHISLPRWGRGANQTALLIHDGVRTAYEEAA